MAKILDIRLLPFDIGRLACIPFAIVNRVKCIRIGTQKQIRGGAIVVSNHTSFGDPLTLACCFSNRRMYYLTAEITMGGPIRSFFMRGLGCIKIDRNISDMEAIRQSVRRLKEGRLLAMFPEGGIQHSDHVAELKLGAALIAAQADVPIIPVYINRKKHWYDRRIAVVGEPVYGKDYCTGRIPARNELQTLSAELAERMEQCHKEYEKRYQLSHS